MHEGLPGLRQGRTQGAVSKIDGRIVIDRALCDGAVYARFADACLYDALQLVGRRVTVDELVSEVEKDAIFYEQSGGGVTFSGGKPLLQHEFLSMLIDALKAGGVRTALPSRRPGTGKSARFGGLFSSAAPFRRRIN